MPEGLKGATEIGKQEGQINDLPTSLGGYQKTIKQVGEIINGETLIRFGLCHLSDLKKEGEPHKNLLSKSLGTYKGIDITFQSTRCDEGGFIAEHSHNNPEKNGITDELIIMMNERGVYGDIGAFLDHNGIMRIQAGANHGGKSNGNWISLKPKEYDFIEGDDKSLIYGNGQKKIKIMKLSGDKVFSTSELGYKEDVLFLEFGEGLVNIRKSTNDKILSSWDFIVMGEV